MPTARATALCDPSTRMTRFSAGMPVGVMPDVDTGVPVLLQQEKLQCALTGVPAMLYSMSTMGDRIRLVRKERKLSQTAVADAAGVKYQTIQDLEKNKSVGSTRILAIARTLGVTPEWLQQGKGEKYSNTREAMLVGEVGAAAEVVRFDEGVVMEGTPVPPGSSAVNAARVRGESMPPFRDGWLIFYGAEHQHILEDCIGKLCVVGLKDGTTLVKILHYGSRKGLFDLESWNAPMRRDVKVEWASRVTDIRPV